MTRSPNPVTAKTETEIVATERVMATLKTTEATSVVTLITAGAVTTETGEATETAEATATAEIAETTKTAGTTVTIVATATNVTIGTTVTILTTETNGIPMMTVTTVVSSMIAVHTSLTIAMIVAEVKLDHVIATMSENGAPHRALPSRVFGFD